MWIEDQDASSSSHSASPAPASPPSLINCKSRDESVIQSRPIRVSHMGKPIHVRSFFYCQTAYYPVVLSRNFDQVHHRSDSIQVQEAMESRRDKPAATLVALSSANLVASQVADCSRCSIKDTEIRQLRKRVQELEEQLCRALGNSK